jgi:excisionase family DNA binding protein
LSAYRPPRYDLLGAPVHGVSAWVLVGILERAKALDSIQRLPPEARAEVLETYDGLRAAGIYWNQRHQDALADSPEPPPTAEAENEDSEPYLSAVEAARILGCSDRRIRQLVTDGVLSGKRVAGRWLIDADSVDDRAVAQRVA